MGQPPPPPPRTTNSIDLRSGLWVLAGGPRSSDPLVVLHFYLFFNPHSSLSRWGGRRRGEPSCGVSGCGGSCRGWRVSSDAFVWVDPMLGGSRDERLGTAAHILEGFLGPGFPG